MRNEIDNELAEEVRSRLSHDSASGAAGGTAIQMEAMSRVLTPEG